MKLLLQLRTRNQGQLRPQAKKSGVCRSGRKPPSAKSIKVIHAARPPAGSLPRRTAGKGTPHRDGPSPSDPPGGGHKIPTTYINRSRGRRRSRTAGPSRVCAKNARPDQVCNAPAKQSDARPQLVTRWPRDQHRAGLARHRPGLPGFARTPAPRRAFSCGPGVPAWRRDVRQLCHVASLRDCSEIVTSPWIAEASDREAIGH